MDFLTETVEEPITHFQVEHAYAMQHIADDGIKNIRFLSSDNQSVAYLTSIHPLVMNLDGIEGVIFFKSMPIKFSASRYGGHMATEIKLEKVSVPQELHKYEKEISALIHGILNSYLEWYKLEFWKW